MDDVSVVHDDGRVRILLSGVVGAEALCSALEVELDHDLRPTRALVVAAELEDVAQRLARILGAASLTTFTSSSSVFADANGDENKSLIAVHVKEEDEPAANLLPALRVATELAGQAVAEAGEDGRQTILVSCQGGVSRSATCAAAMVSFLRHSGESAESNATHPMLSARLAVETIRQKRSVVAPNDGFMRQLSLFLFHELDVRQRRDRSSRKEEFDLKRTMFRDLWSREVCHRRKARGGLSDNAGYALDPLVLLEGAPVREQDKDSPEKKGSVQARCCSSCRLPLSIVCLHEFGSALDWRRSASMAQPSSEKEDGQNHLVWVDWLPWMETSVRDGRELNCPRCHESVGLFWTLHAERKLWDEAVVGRIRARAQATSADHAVVALPEWMCVPCDRGEFTLDLRRTCLLDYQ